MDRAMPTPDMGTTDLFKTISVGFAAIVSGIMGFRSWRRRDRLAQAGTDADISSYKRLEDQLAAMTSRAELAERERNQLYVKLGELTGKVEALQQEIVSLRRELREARNG